MALPHYSMSGARAAGLRLSAHPGMASGESLVSWQHDHILARLLRIEPLHQSGATFQPRALVDVALVGQLIAVDRRRLDHQHGTRDAQAAGSAAGLVVSFEAALEAGDHHRM